MAPPLKSPTKSVRHRASSCMRLLGRAGPIGVLPQVAPADADAAAPALRLQANARLIALGATPMAAASGGGARPGAVAVGAAAATAQKAQADRGATTPDPLCMAAGAGQRTAVGDAHAHY